MDVLTAVAIEQRVEGAMPSSMQTSVLSQYPNIDGGGDGDGDGGVSVGVGRR